MRATLVVLLGLTGCEAVLGLQHAREGRPDASVTNESDASSPSPDAPIAIDGHFPIDATPSPIDAPPPTVDAPPPVDAAVPDAYSCAKTTCGADVGAPVCVDLMTDPAHCNACDTSCPQPPHTTPTCELGVCGTTCTGSFGDCTAAPGCETDLSLSGGKCPQLTLATGINQPQAIAVSDHLVFFTEGDGKVYTLPKDLAATPTPFPFPKWLAVAGSKYYFVDATTNTISVVNDDGTGETSLAAVPAASFWIDPAGGFIYYTVPATGCTCLDLNGNSETCDPTTPDVCKNANACACATGAQLWRENLDGSSPAQATTQSFAAVDAVAFAPPNVIVAEPAEQCAILWSWNLYTVAPDGTTNMIGASARDMSTPPGLAADAQGAWVNGIAYSGCSCSGCTYSAAVFRVPLVGGSAENVIAGNATTFVTDGTNDFFRIDYLNRIYEIPVGGKPSDAASVSYTPVTDFAADGAFLYLTDSSSGSVVRLAK